MSMNVNQHRATNVSNQTIQKAQNTPQSTERAITKELKNVKNSIEQLDIKIESYKSTRNTLVAIAKKSGEKASIRLKGNNFKPGSGNAFFSGNRYQKERLEAAKLLGVKGNVVSASEAIKILSSQIDSFEGEKAELAKNHTTDKPKNVGQQSNNGKVGTVKTAKISTNKSDAEKKENREKFSLLYQTNVGCEALNAEARCQSGQSKMAGRLKGDDVILEYRKVHDYEIFSGGNAKIERNIETYSKNLKEIVHNAADAFYTPSRTIIDSFRGQDMTSQDLNTLFEQFKENKDQVYKPGRFFSTSKNIDIAKQFIQKENAMKKVIFEIKGNSSNPVIVRNGLAFGHKVTEEERLYSPKAHFKINNFVKNSKTGIYKIQMEEVAQTQHAKLLP